MSDDNTSFCSSPAQSIDSVNEKMVASSCKERLETIDFDKRLQRPAEC